MGKLHFCINFCCHNIYLGILMQKYIFFDRFRCFLSDMAEIDAFAQEFHYGVGSITLKLRFCRFFGASRAENEPEEPDKLKELPGFRPYRSTPR